MLLIYSKDILTSLSFSDCFGNKAFRKLFNFNLSFSPSYDWMRSISVRNPSMRHNRKVSLVFNHLEPEELADHLVIALETKLSANYSILISLSVHPMTG